MEAGHTKFHPDWHFGLWKVLVIIILLCKSKITVSKNASEDIPPFL
jgi:hypothetical protein